MSGMVPARSTWTRAPLCGAFYERGEREQRERQRERETEREYVREMSMWDGVRTWVTESAVVGFGDGSLSGIGCRWSRGGGAIGRGRLRLCPANEGLGDDIRKRGIWALNVDLFLVVCYRTESLCDLCQTTLEGFGN